MRTIILNNISKKSANFENKVLKLIPEGINEIYLSSCGMKRKGSGSYNYFLEIQINNSEHLTLYSHTNSAPVWDYWTEIESGSIKHDNFKKNTALMLLEERKEEIIEFIEELKNY